MKSEAQLPPINTNFPTFKAKVKREENILIVCTEKKTSKKKIKTKRNKAKEEKKTKNKKRIEPSVYNCVYLCKLYSMKPVELHL